MARVIRYIIGSAFRYAGSRITFEKFGDSPYRSREMGEAFRVLEKAMLLQLILPCYKGEAAAGGKVSDVAQVADAGYRHSKSFGRFAEGAYPFEAN